MAPAEKLPWPLFSVSDQVQRRHRGGIGCTWSDKPRCTNGFVFPGGLETVTRKRRRLKPRGTHLRHGADCIPVGGATALCPSAGLNTWCSHKPSRWGERPAVARIQERGGASVCVPAGAGCSTERARRPSLPAERVEGYLLARPFSSGRCGTTSGIFTCTSPRRHQEVGPFLGWPPARGSLFACFAAPGRTARRRDDG